MAVIVVVPLAAVVQGIDFTDTGWVLSNYVNVFSAPESVSFWFHMWFSNVIGGVWFLLFGWAGLLGMKLGAVVIFWATAALVWFGLRDVVSKRLILAGIALALAYNFIGKITVVHYNNLSALFFVASAVCLLKGLRTERTIWFFTAGILVCANTLVRLSNMLSLCFVAVIGYQALVERRFSGRHARLIAWFAAGFLSSAVVAAGVMTALGHFNLYVASVRDLFSHSPGESSSYGLLSTLKMFVKDHVRALVISGVGAAALYGAAYLALKLQHRSVKLFGASILFAAAFGFAILARGRIPPNLYFYFPVGFSYLVALGIILTPTVDKLAKQAAVLGAFMLMCLSVGSDTGMKVATYGLIWMFPLVAAASARALDLGRMSLRLSSAPGGAHSIAILFFFALYAGYATVNLYVDVYRDSGNRFAMTKTVDQPMLRDVPTTPQRVRVVGELFVELEKHVKPGDYLLTFESIGMVYFVTRTRPYAGSPWPLLYQPSEFKRYLRRDEAKIGLPAAIVTARKQTRNGAWPAAGPVSDNAVSIADRQIFQDFVNRNGYAVAWQNDMFNIYLKAGQQ